MLEKLNLKIWIAFIIINTVFIFSVFPFSYAGAEKISEITTERGKVIIGLSKKEAAKKFGLPDQASEKFWYYYRPENFWVYFRKPTELISISILPEITTTTAGNPVMFKAIGEFSDFTNEDITEDVEWISENTKVAGFVEDGVLLSFSEGTTQVFAICGNIISTIIDLNIKAGEKEEKPARKIKLIALDIIPQDPRVSFRRDKMEFKALGTFKNLEKNEYFVRDVTSDEVLTWHSKNEGVVSFVDNIAYFSVRAPVQTEIFCSKDSVVSPVQSLTLLDTPFITPGSKLESIIVLPQTIVTVRNKRTEFRAFGTFTDGSFKEITLDANWTMDNYKIASLVDKGTVVTKKAGVTEIKVFLDEVFSQPRKVAVLRELPQAEVEEGEKIKPVEKPRGRVEIKKTMQIERSPRLIAGVKEQLKELKEKMASSLERKLKTIQTIPINPDVPLGNELQFRAKGEYSDGSFRDLTSQVKWQSSNTDVAAITQVGFAQSMSMGTTLISASLDKINSDPQHLTVSAPRLVSIVVSPSNPTVNVAEVAQFKALGEYTDKSKKDITSEASWMSDEEGVAKFVDGGKLNALRAGKARIFAKSEEIESISQLVTVVPLPLTKFVWMNMLRMFNLFLFSAIFFLIFMSAVYLRRYINTQRLKRLIYNNPRLFITRIYHDLVSVFKIYGLGRKKSIPAGEYLKQLRQRYAEADGMEQLVNFTERFNEARYSSHVVTAEAASNSAREYDIIIFGIRKFNRLRLNLIARFKMTLKKLPSKISS